jgi:molecular chaperone DnaK
VYQTEKVLREQGDKVDERREGRRRGPLAELKTALNGNDMEAIKAAHEALMQASQAFSQKLYEKAAAENAAGSRRPPARATRTDGDDDDIIDAEIVDDEK